MGNYPFTATSGFVSGEYLCPPSQYAPASPGATLDASGVNLTTFSASISTGNFTAPASGDVIVTADFIATNDTGLSPLVFGLLDGSSNPYGDVTIYQDSSTFVPRPYSVKFRVTGLTPGTVYDLFLAGAAAAGDNLYILALGEPASATPSQAHNGGPVIMTVQAV